VWLCVGREAMVVAVVALSSSLGHRVVSIGWLLSLQLRSDVLVSVWTRDVVVESVGVLCRGFYVLSISSLSTRGRSDH
jgi:hypothetical protein